MRQQPWPDPSPTRPQARLGPAQPGPARPGLGPARFLFLSGPARPGPAPARPGPARPRPDPISFLFPGPGRAGPGRGKKESRAAGQIGRDCVSSCSIACCAAAGMSFHGAGRPDHFCSAASMNAWRKKCI